MVAPLSSVITSGVSSGALSTVAVYVMVPPSSTAGVASNVTVVVSLSSLSTVVVVSLVSRASYSPPVALVILTTMSVSGST